MSGARPKVVLTRKWPHRVEAKLAEQFDVELNVDDHPFTFEEFESALKTADAICPTVTDRLDGRLFDCIDKKVKMLANYGAGTEHIDIEAAHRNGITVTNTPGILTEATAEITIALMLMVARRASEGEQWIRANKWDGWSPTQMLSTGITGKTLGLVGMGRIATRVAEIAGHGFNMTIQYFSRSEVPSQKLAGLAVSRVSLEQLLSTSDFVSIHCPASFETRGLIDSDALDLMSKNSFLINTARGSIVDEKALAYAVKNNSIAGTGLDVYEHEPRIHPDLLKSDRVVLLPHIGSGTVETREAMGYRVLENLTAFFAGHSPPNLIHC